jgi:ankyrin repeat protein
VKQIIIRMASSSSSDQQQQLQQLRSHNRSRSSGSALRIQDDTNATTTSTGTRISTDRRLFFDQRSWQSASSLFPADHQHRLSNDYDNDEAGSAGELQHQALWQVQEQWARGDNALFGAATTTTTPFLAQQPFFTANSSSSAPTVDSASGLSSCIHDAARITNWDAVLELCGTQPQHARYASTRDGWTALHHLCNRRCPAPRVAEALIRAYPGALCKGEEKGWLPLHYACRFKAPKEVVRLLLHMYPEKGLKTVSKVDRMGRTPLYYAIRYDAPPGVVGLLLQVDPSAVLEKDQNDDSPLALVWDSWADKLEGKRVVNSFLPGGFPEPEDRSVEERAQILRVRLQKETKLLKRWMKVNMLLKAAFGFPVEEDEVDEKMDADDPHDTKSERTWRIVHAAAAVRCHSTIFLLACALHPEQVRELDCNDLIPQDGPTNQTALHLAASSNAGGETGKTVLLSLLSQYREAAQLPDGIDASLPLHRMVENEHKQDWSNHAAILYQFYQRGVQIPDSNGKLPLHRAIGAMKHTERQAEECVITQLVRVYPQAAAHADKSGLLPMHMVAAHAAIWDHDTESVCNAHRNAVMQRAGDDQFSRLPIHMAAASVNSRDSLIARLIQLHPRSVSLEDARGSLPLHLACEVGKNWNDGTRAIYAAFPTAVSRAENSARGWLPLHLAANASAAGPELIQELIQLYPAAASIADAQGRYPLHLACGSGKSWMDGLADLFEVAPDTMTTRDNRGMLPFHIASLRLCRPDGEQAKDDDEDAFDYKTTRAAEDKHDAADLDILFQLLRADPTVADEVKFHNVETITE